MRLRHGVAARGVRFVGDDATPTDAVLGVLAEAPTIVIAPSNPIVSIGPIRSFPAVEALLTSRRGHTVAVSPIVGGAALKGPADRLLTELGHEATRRRCRPPLRARSPRRWSSIRSTPTSPTTFEPPGWSRSCNRR